ncbi:MAG TPA: AmmeMemoRadiSam system protein B [Anaerolineales bacterium]|nr:AmmeMemoRadiSam system protein B [Anaerolineales bacterium]
MNGPDIRPSPIAGQWYPADQRRLADSVDGYIRAAGSIAIEGEIVAIMAPHAGHLYSGPVAGYAFAALQGLKPELAAVVSPMHYPYHEPLLTSAHEAYSTPLGTIPVDRQAIDALEAQLQILLGHGLEPLKNDPEHSLEIELPFLQRALDTDFRLLPVMVRDASPRLTRLLGKALAAVLSGRQAILVASTDLSHFYPQNVARNLDGEILRRVEAFDPAGLLKAEEEGKGFACGRGALAAVMWAAQDLGANRARVLNYATSGDVTGDFSQVVGYGAAVFFSAAS